MHQVILRFFSLPPYSLQKAKKRLKTAKCENINNKRTLNKNILIQVTNIL